MFETENELRNLYSIIKTQLLRMSKPDILYSVLKSRPSPGQQTPKLN
jgi:hypothetical protein